MKHFLFSSLLFILSIGVAKAGDRNSAYNFICKPMTWESSKNECVAKIKIYNYFDDQALALCAKLPFDNDKISCLGFVGNKTYESYEMDMCLNQPFDSQKVECLKNNGTPYETNQRICVPREEAISQLSNGINEMRRGDLKSADNRLNFLLNRFIRCQDR